eukprot:m.100270 g.100270  ORF g.100270 m.100270 type:complete len:270 (-) comp27231_c0_seq3:226-1035(-)
MMGGNAKSVVVVVVVLLGFFAILQSGLPKNTESSFDADSTVTEIDKEQIFETKSIHQKRDQPITIKVPENNINMSQTAEVTPSIVTVATSTVGRVRNTRLEAVSATASNRGNLGLADVVLSSKVDDWLKDRWQATPTGNMAGVPLKLPQWICIALKSPASTLSKVVVDFETGFADEYRIEVAATPDDHWWPVVLVSPSESSGAKHVRGQAGVGAAMTTKEWKQHVEHTIVIEQGAADIALPLFKYVRVVFTHLGTSWGVSVWRFEVSGH